MKKAFVLGGTVPHKALIEKLKEMGYYTVLIDYTNHPPAASAADLHLKESTLDKEKVLELAKEYKVDLVISTCIDQANSTACYVAEKLGLPHPYSFATSLDVTRKGQMKKIFKAYGIPTSDFYILDQYVAEEPRLPFPLVVKPTDANSSKGVFKVETPADFLEKLKISFSFSREGKAIVERFVSGTEIQVDCYAENGIAKVLMTKDKKLMQLDGKELQMSGFSIPGNLCERHRDELQNIAQKIVTAFHLETTPFFYQAVCNDDGIFVLEFAPRIAGGTTYEMVEIYSGVDYLDAAIKSFLHETPTVNPVRNFNKYSVEILYMKPGTFDHVDGLEELISSGELMHYFPFANKGKEISASINSGNRIGGIMAKGQSYEEIEIKLKKAMQKIAVIDDQGRDLSYWK